MTDLRSNRLGYETREHPTVAENGDADRRLRRDKVATISVETLFSLMISAPGGHTGRLFQTENARSHNSEKRTMKVSSNRVTRRDSLGGSSTTVLSRSAGSAASMKFTHLKGRPNIWIKDSL